MAIVQVEDIRKEYHTGEITTHVLNGISLSVDEGEFVSIMGPSGSGKSTLMHILGFLDRATSGIYRFEGNDTAGFNADQLADIRNGYVGFIFQAFNLLPRITALENVCLPLIYTDIPHSQHVTRGTDVLRQVGLADRMHHKPNELSGGQQQRVAIARALINNPAIIFADEPTGNLDSKSSFEIMALLQALNNEGHTIVIVTHEDDVASTTKRRVILRDGLIMEDYPIEQHIVSLSAS